MAEIGGISHLFLLIIGKNSVTLKETRRSGNSLLLPLDYSGEGDGSAFIGFSMQ
jgi:hypothetical protein